MIVSWFSGGITSAVATKIALQTYENVVPVFIETGGHHEDMPRFIADCEKWFDTKITIVQDKRFKDHIDLCEKLRVMNFVGGAECSRTLKKKQRQKFEKENKIDHQIFGFEYDKKEINRALRFKDQNPHTNPLFPLIDKKLNKAACMAMVAKAGIELPTMYKLGYSNNNCLSGDTKIITSKGAKTLKSMVNKPALIRTSLGFESATVKDYGLQPCYEVTINRDGLTHKVIASANHRWYVRPRRYREELVVVPTAFLRTGVYIPSAYRGAMSTMSLDGIQHGIVYGDGTASGENSGVKLIGKKLELAKYFPDYKGTKGAITGLPLAFKKLPQITSKPEYLAGFIAGLLATDGCFKDGITLSQAKDMDEIKTICESIGLAVQPIKKIVNDTNFKKNRTLYMLSIISASLPKELDIRSLRKNFRPNHRADDCVITKIKPLGNRRVYCPTTSTSDIALEYNIVTGQCVGCVKGGMGYWDKIRKDFPETFNRMAGVERKLNRTCLKGMFLDEIPDGGGRHKLPPTPECDLFCEIEMADIEHKDLKTYKFEE